MNNLYKRSTLVKSSDVEKYVSALENNKSVILNNSHNFIFATKLFSITEIYKILDLKHVEQTNKNKEQAICLCNGFYDSSTLLELNSTEEKLYKIITDKFWPGSLNICVRGKSFIDSIAKYKNDFIIINSPYNRYIRKILETIRMPLVTFLTNKYNDPPYLNYKEVNDTYESENIPIMNISGINKKVNGIHNTTILIDNNTIKLLQRGPISFTSIQEYIKTNYFDFLNFKTDIQMYINIKPNKPIFTLQLMDLETNNIDKKIIDELKNKTKKLIENVIIIDWKQTLVEYKNYFYGYIDLSQKGSLEEYKDNLYSALQTCMRTDCKKIYITDIHFTVSEEYKYIIDIINHFTCNKNMVIPLLFLK